LIVGFVCFISGVAIADDLAARVREAVLDQRQPVRIFVSTTSATTVQFPTAIQSLEGDAFTKDPSKESGDFYISAGTNWFSLRSLRKGAKTNLGVVINGKVYELYIETADTNDFSVLLRLPASTASTK
jgi:hypothetical protein